VVAGNLVLDVSLLVRCSVGVFGRVVMPRLSTSETCGQLGVSIGRSEFYVRPGLRLSLSLPPYTVVVKYTQPGNAMTSRQRKTTPVPVQVIPPFKPTNALIQGRLIDFDTGSSVLEEQHMDFLNKAMHRAKTNSAYYIRIFGYASHLGDATYNLNLSRARMQEVYNYLRRQDGRVVNSIEMFDAYGESRSIGGENDNSPEYRAVEVHIFIGALPPIDPPDKRRVEPPHKLPLPGGPRSGRWEVGTPGGITFTVGPSLGPLTAGATVGGNLFAVRNLDPGPHQPIEDRRYIQLVGGLGASLGLPANLTSFKNIVQTLLSGANWSGLSFEPVFPKHAVTWGEVESCFVNIRGANAGLLISGSIAVIDFDCPDVWQYGPSGTPIHTNEEIWSFNSAGRNWQIGAGASATTGRLIRLG
jgi:outer membrane protein OmpA-like peptidoglycan-associated protein